MCPLARCSMCCALAFVCVLFCTLQIYCARTRKMFAHSHSFGALNNKATVFLLFFPALSYFCLFGLCVHVADAFKYNYPFLSALVYLCKAQKPTLTICVYTFQSALVHKNTLQNCMCFPSIKYPLANCTPVTHIQKYIFLHMLGFSPIRSHPFCMYHIVLYSQYTRNNIL